MLHDVSEGGSLEAAIQRLDRALTQLDLRVTGLAAQAGSGNGELFDLDRSALAAELDAARGRERELEEAGAQASAAIGLAIAELRQALTDDEDEIEDDVFGDVGGADEVEEV
ncbi:DUF4164 family protein [Phenylobacterium montanum]|uniref:DUF4164 family protein n=1 Tax=Phenylobacterium montanum TaxID=2823693 RepID=A0A975FX70_9CAUL|nr:DUF4164 family protein [Caulobacter sp. S6]QUD86587.1 DUF4164 family protein [Caulobacter sp. S6]